MTKDFLGWLRGWIGHHPLKTPPDSASYTVEVMARVHAASQRMPAFRWAAQPWWVLAVGTVAAAWAVTVVVGRSPQRLAETVSHETELLAQVDGDTLLSVSPDSVEQEVALMDRMVLAQAEGEPDDEAWLEDTLELLNATGEDVEIPSADDASDGWLQELETLDDREAASS